ncbi:MAG: hypothetical protein AB7O38_21755, partial [Pirellulaceae bacterium]
YGWGGCLASATGAESRFAVTNSRGQYVHWIELYDADGRQIDMTDSAASPYSPVHTCGRCHDYEQMAHGYHFQAATAAERAGRPGEPWVWVDTRTGTQLPLSYRGWKGTYDPRQVGISDWEFLLQFGRHLPGRPDSEKTTAAMASGSDGTSSSGDSANPAADRWRLAGRSGIDCMFCHAAPGTYNPEVWRDQIALQNFAWAPTAAAGLATVTGAVAELPDDFDPAAASANGPELPTVQYDVSRLRSGNKMWLDIVRTPPNSACYYCHTQRRVDEPTWNHDEDVHVQAGMQCADCHRHDLAHHTVRGFEGESHPTGAAVHSLSCRGCHEGSASAEAGSGGRLGAPRPLHRGLPALHFERLSCTACHSGPRPDEEAQRIHTALAHGLGLPSHEYSAESPPGVVAPVFLPEGSQLYPHRAMWPAFWGKIARDEIVPLHPEFVNETLRRLFRIRRGSTFTEVMSEAQLTAEEKQAVLGADRRAVPEAEWTPEERGDLRERELAKAVPAFHKKLADALRQLGEATRQTPGEPVYVAGGKAFRLAWDGTLDEFDHPGARPYAWKLAHDVRPARTALGARGCVECHAAGTPLFRGRVVASGPAPDLTPPRQAMFELAGLDGFRLDAWNLSFRGRAVFKYVGFAAMVVTGWLALSLLLTAFDRSWPYVPWHPAVWGLYVALLASVAALALTSAIPLLRTGALRGWWLMAHMSAAGAFVVFLPTVGAALYAQHRSHAAAWGARPLSAASRLTFGLLLGSGWIVAMTMLASMLPWFGTEGLSGLLQVHVISGIATAAFATAHALSVGLQVADARAARRASGST